MLVRFDVYYFLSAFFIALSSKVALIYFSSGWFKQGFSADSATKLDAVIHLAQSSHFRQFPDRAPLN
jgi:hypothetical protein